MSIAANTIWEIRTDGADTNGGAFLWGAAGTDYSQQASPQLSVSDAACTGNTTLTSATGGFTSAMVGNHVYLSSGPNWYRITAYTDTNTVTIDRNGPNASGMTANVGGALASVGGLGAAFVACTPASRQVAYMKSGTYSITTGTYNVSNGPYYNTGFQAAIIGYETTRGDFGAKPLLQASGVSSITFLTATSYVSTFWNISVDGNGNSSITGFGSHAHFCDAEDCDIGFNGQSVACTTTYCKATNCGTYGFQSPRCAYKCLAIDCVTGFVTPSVAINCIAHGCTAGYAGSGSVTLVVIGCDFDGNTNDGISHADFNSVLIDNICSYNGGYGINPLTQERGSFFLLNNRFISNTSGDNHFTTPTDLLGATLSGDPYTDKSSDLFDLNDTAGAGAACRGAGTDMPGQTDASDIGAVQHADPAGGGLLQGGGMTGGFQRT